MDLAKILRNIAILGAIIGTLTAYATYYSHDTIVTRLNDVKISAAALREGDKTGNYKLWDEGIIIETDAGRFVKYPEGGTDADRAYEEFFHLEHLEKELNSLKGKEVEIVKHGWDMAPSWLTTQRFISVRVPISGYHWSKNQ